METGAIITLVLELILVICIIATALSVDKLRREVREVYDQCYRIMEAIKHKDR